MHYLSNDEWRNGCCLAVSIISGSTGHGISLGRTKDFDVVCVASNGFRKCLPMAHHGNDGGKQSFFVLGKQRTEAIPNENSFSFYFVLVINKWTHCRLLIHSFVKKKKTKNKSVAGQVQFTRAPHNEYIICDRKWTTEKWNIEFLGQPSSSSSMSSSRHRHSEHIQINSDVSTVYAQARAPAEPNKICHWTLFTFREMNQNFNWYNCWHPVKCVLWRAITKTVAFSAPNATLRIRYFDCIPYTSTYSVYRHWIAKEWKTINMELPWQCDRRMKTFRFFFRRSIQWKNAIKHLVR